MEHFEEMKATIETTLTRDLSAYQNQPYTPGRRLIIRMIWYYVSLVFFESGWLPFTQFKPSILRLFGANIGRRVVIHPNVRIKYPWKLVVGDHCWIGREAWIDNLDQVTLESDVCISQGAYLCTGSHDHRSPTFELQIAPILVRHGAWVAARAILLPGAVVECGEVVSAGTIVKRKRKLADSPCPELAERNAPGLNLLAQDGSDDES